MKHSLLLFIGSLALCLVAVEGINKQKLIKACTDRGGTSEKCTQGVSELEKGLAKNNNFAGYLNILGFGVPGYTGPALSIFWTGFAVTDVIDVTSSLSDSNPKFFTSFNILPAAVMNDAGGTTAVGLTTEQGKMFWAQFSTWMATKTAGKFAFWLTGGTTDGFFPPCGKYPRCYFEVYELPYLQVKTLVVLHLPAKRSTASKSECANDRKSYEKLQSVNNEIWYYYCCELPAVDESTSLDDDVFDLVSAIATDLEKDAATVPKLCIDMQKQFPPRARL